MLSDPTSKKDPGPIMTTPPYMCTRLRVRSRVVSAEAEKLTERYPIAMMKAILAHEAHLLSEGELECIQNFVHLPCAWSDRAMDA